jgi:tetratricopeptide (TPR) repeat protein
LSLWRFCGLAAVFGLKCLVLAQLHDHPLLHPDAGLDTTAYAGLAARVLAGDVALGPGLYFVLPLYIYFLVSVLALFDSYLAVRIVQIALGTASVACIFLMARAWFGDRAAWIAAGLAALTGLFTFYEVLILQSAIDAVLTSAALLALTLALAGRTEGRKDGRTETRSRVRENVGPPERERGRQARRAPASEASVSAWGWGPTRTERRRTEGRNDGKTERRGRAAWFVVAGIVFGVATLNRPNMTFGAAAIVAALIATRRVRPAALLVAGALAGVAPVTIRNVVVAGQWTPVSSHGGLNFAIGNGEGATGFYRQLPGITPTIGGQADDARRVAEGALGRPLSDAEVSGYFYGIAWRWMREHPLDAAGLFARKLAYTFSATHVALPHSYPFYAIDERAALRFYAIGPWLLVPLGLCGLVFAAPRGGRAEYLVWIAFVPGYAAGVVAFFVAERYRLPLLVPLCVGAGAAIDAGARAVVRRHGSRDQPPLKRRRAALLTFAVLAVAVNWPLGLHDGRWEEGLRTAQRLAIVGRYDEADEYVRRFDPRGPYPGATHAGVAGQLLLLDQPRRALAHLERAHEKSPSRREIEETLADTLLRVGRLTAREQTAEAAEPYFRRAAALRPDLAAARVQYGLNLLVLGRLEDARRELAEAARLDPRDADALAHLAYCEFQLGRAAEARVHVAAALAIDPQHDLARRLSSMSRR